MKKAISTAGLVAMLFATLGLSLAAQQIKPMSWNGWVSDSACAAKGTNADHKACAAKCVKEKGASWVFVDSKSKKVLPIHNQDAVNADTSLGQEMKVTGHVMDDGSLHVDSMAPVNM